VNKLITVAFFCVLITGCGGPSSSHSDYFIVGFLPATLEPTADGKIAVGNALHEAGGATRVTIEGAVNDSPSNAENGVLVQQRAAELEQSFVKAGLAARQIKLHLREVGDGEFANRKDTLIVQVGFGSEPEDEKSEK
jgi:hypothetical protein